MPIITVHAQTGALPAWKPEGRVGLCDVAEREGDFGGAAAGEEQDLEVDGVRVVVVVALGSRGGPERGVCGDGV